MSQAIKKKSAGRCDTVDVAGAAVLLAMTGLFYLLAVRPTLQNHDHAITQHGQVQADAQKVTAVQSQLKQLQTQATDIEKSSVGPTLEPVTALNRRLAKIADLASARKLDLEDMHPGIAAGTGRYVTVPITLSGSGTFRSCVDYLHDLHQQLADVAVSSVNLSANPETADNAPTAKFQLELRWYAAAPTAIPTATPTPVTAVSSAR